MTEPTETKGQIPASAIPAKYGGWIRPWVKGQSGNPSGLAKDGLGSKDHPIRATLRRELAKRRNLRRMITAWIDTACDPENPGAGTAREQILKRLDPVLDDPAAGRTVLEGLKLELTHKGVSLSLARTATQEETSVPYMDVHTVDGCSVDVEEVSVSRAGDGAEPALEPAPSATAPDALSASRSGRESAENTGSGLLLLGGQRPLSGPVRPAGPEESFARKDLPESPGGTRDARNPAKDTEILIQETSEGTHESRESQVLLESKAPTVGFGGTLLTRSQGFECEAARETTRLGEESLEVRSGTSLTTTEPHTEGPVAHAGSSQPG